MVQESTATTDNMLVDFADIVLTLIDLKMFSVASFYSDIFSY